MRRCECGRQSKVIESRTLTDGNVYRVRRCEWCITAWRTVERMVPWDAIQLTGEDNHTYRVKEGYENEVLS